MYVEYTSNNSGGVWWLSDQNWKDLEIAGWSVQWESLTQNYDKEGFPEFIDKPDKFAQRDDDGKYRRLGALAVYAYRPNCSSIKEAGNEWEGITGESALDSGCPCCGQPHRFTLYDEEGEWIDSGPDMDYSGSW